MNVNNIFPYHLKKKYPNNILYLISFAILLYIYYHNTLTQFINEEWKDNFTTIYFIKIKLGLIFVKIDIAKLMIISLNAYVKN